MKRLLCTILAALLAIVPAAWISQARAESAGIFQPRLDTDTSCEITVVGSYSNFEALEAEFECFNEFYPNVELTYLKPDDYNNLLGTVLESKNPTLSNSDGECPLDFDAVMKNPAEFKIVATDSISGKPHYFDTLSQS